MVNADQVRVGTPDQLTTGAILSAPTGTTLPTSASAELDEGFVDSGYVSADGLTLAPDMSTADINEWGGALVRRLLETFDGTLSWSHLETNENSLKNTFGDANVTVTPADSTHGKQIEVAIGASLPEVKSWAFKIKDGAERILIVVPRGQVTTVDEISFVSNDAIMWPVTLSTYPDSEGHCIYIYTDDGQVAKA